MKPQKKIGNTKSKSRTKVDPNVKYLQKRPDGIYEFKRFFPFKLQPMAKLYYSNSRAFKKSLGTRDITEAKKLQPSLLDEYRALEAGLIDAYQDHYIQSMLDDLVARGWLTVSEEPAGDLESA